MASNQSSHRAMASDQSSNRAMASSESLNRAMASNNPSNIAMTSSNSLNSFPDPFNEQECREYIAYELGDVIPRLYRYAQGIHEVQKRLIIRYGDTNYGKAMDVFRELMENNDCASGLGDAGDAWRSWRFDYKHRGVSDT